MTRTKTPKLSKEEKAELDKNKKCINCKNAYLMRLQNNPIIAMCTKNENRREVARMHICNIGLFEELKGEPTIHPMIPPR